ncbi:MAG: 23S rRNA (pseudouridine(1915)-N(3))-methyltransferase RlmH, partial [Pseudomonadota bacterium]
MRVHIVAVGRLRKGAEYDLVTEYRTRFDRTGRAL